MNLQKLLSVFMACAVMGTAVPKMEHPVPEAITAQAAEVELPDYTPSVADYSYTTMVETTTTSVTTTTTTTVTTTMVTTPTSGTYGDLSYEVSNGKITILACNWAATEVNIPSEINGMPVVAISNSAFQYCFSLTSITILNPACEIFNNSYTIPYNAVIYGYPNSTAQKYAENYGYTFVALDEPAAETAFGIATFIGILGMDSCWGYEDVNSLSKAATITGDAQYEVIWDISESGGTASIEFLCVQINPLTLFDSFTTDDFPDLEVTIDEVWIDNTLVENYSTSENAVNTRYYEEDGVTRLYLHDDWAGTDVTDLPDDTTIVDNIRVKFTVSGLGTDGVSNVSPDPEPEITTTTTTAATTYTTTTTTTTTTATSSEFMIIPPTLKMSPGDTSTLLVINALDDSTVQWTSDNTDVVTVLNGVAIAVNKGTATIYAVCGNSVATCKVTVGASGIIYGDADCDGEVGIADVVKIMTHLTTPGGTLSDEGINNADVYQRGDGIGNMDALAVQKKIAQLITELPESYM